MEAGYFLINTIKTNLTDEKWKEFRKISREGWIPIFQDWVHYETLYLEKIDLAFKIIEAHYPD